MKTTIEIADPVLRQARKLAEARGTTLRALVEQGLRLVVADSIDKSAPAFRLRKASFKGKGLQAEAAAASPAQLIALSYEGRGA